MATKLIPAGGLGQGAAAPLAAKTGRVALCGSGASRKNLLDSLGLIKQTPMKLTFQLRFHTEYGQSLWLTGNPEILGGGDEARAVPLQYQNEHSWRTTIQWPDNAQSGPKIAYHYVLRQADGLLTHEWGDKNLRPELFQHDEVLLVDSWNPAGAFENAFCTEPFQQVLLQANRTAVKASAPRVPTHTFNVRAPLLGKGQTLCLLGGCAALGQWRTARPLLMSRPDGAEDFSAQADLSGQPFPVPYKYGVFDVERGVFVRFEEGANRVLEDAVAPGRHTVVHDGFVALPADTWKGAGVAIPVFSLRGEASFGVGEFTDLKRLADWGARAGLKLIQILPINDTTATHRWRDSYPY
ncbi:MAG: 4-alpha-glucanotransferase, partial [Verrucomicrobia bacterium]|nr:4-alpha-glucanotransferase [Verrucomicrobiota bacterium]